MPNRIAATLLAVAVVAATAPLSAQESRTYVNPNSASDTEALPFSGAVWVGNTLYLSGTIGLNENQEVPDTAEEEARLVMESMKSTLEAAGLTPDDLVTVTVYCSDVSYYQAFNSVYRTYFTGEFPPRAFIGAGTLLFDARFEVQGIAARR